MEFYAVYIQEAHPSDIWQMTSNLRDGVIFRDPRSDAERTGVAESCVRKLGIKFPALVDGIENTVEREYTGWPDRMYLIARDGRVAYKSAPGPFGFHPADLEAALRRLEPPTTRVPRQSGAGVLARCGASPRRLAGPGGAAADQKVRPQERHYDRRSS